MFSKLIHYRNWTTVVGPSQGVWMPMCQGQSVPRTWCGPFGYGHFGIQLGWAQFCPKPNSVAHDFWIRFDLHMMILSCNSGQLITVTWHFLIKNRPWTILLWSYTHNTWIILSKVNQTNLSKNKEKVNQTKVKDQGSTKYLVSLWKYLLLPSQFVYTLFGHLDRCSITTFVHFMTFWWNEVCFCLSFMN